MNINSWSLVPWMLLNIIHTSWGLMLLGWVPTQEQNMQISVRMLCPSGNGFNATSVCGGNKKDERCLPHPASFGQRLNLYDIGFGGSRWWFQMICFFNVHPMLRRFPCWQIFFKGVETHHLGFRWISLKCRHCDTVQYPTRGLTWCLGQDM